MFEGLGLMLVLLRVGSVSFAMMWGCGLYFLWGGRKAGCLFVVLLLVVFTRFGVGFMWCVIRLSIVVGRLWVVYAFLFLGVNRLALARLP